MKSADRSDADIAVITGATGGMGRACSRRLGARYRLVLADVDPAALQAEAAALQAASITVATWEVCDVGDAASVAQLADSVRKAGTLGALVHTAGLSPALADWSAILRVNWQGSLLLLDALRPLARAGTVAVCIASVAGHLAPDSPQIRDIMAPPLASDWLARLEPCLAAYVAAEDAYGLRGPAYAVSKAAVLRLCEQRAADWARVGARIVSISPGLIATPMGLKENRENPGAAVLRDATVLGRLGKPEEIASAVDFLCSEQAAFITGCDLRIDGGGVAAIRHPR